MGRPWTAAMRSRDLDPFGLPGLRAQLVGGDPAEWLSVIGGGEAWPLGLFRGRRRGRRWLPYGKGGDSYGQLARVRLNLELVDVWLYVVFVDNELHGIHLQFPYFRLDV